MRLISILAVVFACAACQSQPNPMTPAGTTTTAEPASNQPPCTNYTVPVTVGGQQKQAVVESCQQPDGSWRITQTTPGLPPQVYVVPPPTQYPSGYPYSDYYTYPFIILIGPPNRGSSGLGPLSWWHRDFRISTTVSATVSAADSLTVSTAGPLTVSTDMAGSAVVSPLGTGVAGIANPCQETLASPKMR